MSIVRREDSVGILSSGSWLEDLGGWFAAEYESLLRFAYFLTADRATAEDLVQEAFLRVARAGGRVEGPGFPAYARKTIVNLARSNFRRARIARRAASTIRLRFADDPADSVNSYDVRRALLDLPIRQRACLALRFYEDKKETEIADVLGVSVASVRKQIERAKKRLRVVLKEAEDL